MKKSEEPNPVISVGRGISSEEAFGLHELWQKATFAPCWYQDACSQAKNTGDVDCRRREIVFSVTAVESYLFEWVRDDVLHLDFKKLVFYFPPGKHRPVLDKWKDIPKKLVTDGLISASPGLGGDTWRSFGSLVRDYRNGLIHASASRPESFGLPEDFQPKPSMLDLSNLPAGWALETITRLIVELNTAAGTQPPSWLTQVAS